MEPLTMMTLAMQAAGAASTLFDAQNSKQVLREGRKLEHAGIMANIELAKTSAAEESLAALESLKQTIGSQIAVQSARGTATGAGSALFIQQESMGQFNRGERARRMKLLAQQASLRASDVISGMELYKSETQLGRQTTGQLSKLMDTMQTGNSFLKKKA